jgi:hypothetical protein
MLKTLENYELLWQILLHFPVAAVQWLSTLELTLRPRVKNWEYFYSSNEKCDFQHNNTQHNGTHLPIMLSVIMLSVIKLSVLAP